MGRNPFHQPRVLKAPSSLALSTAREGAVTVPLGSLGQGLTTRRVPYIQSKSPLFQREAITPCPLTPCPCKKFLSSFLAGPFRYSQAVVRSPRSLLFPRLNSPISLSISSQQMGSSPQIISVASSGPTPTGACLSGAEGSRSLSHSFQITMRFKPPPLPCVPWSVNAYLEQH